MSSVRMCDRCGTIFSELDSGWQTFSASTFTEDDDGNRKAVSVLMDACPSCALETPKNRRERRTAELERNAGVAPDFTLPEIKDEREGTSAEPADANSL